MKKIITTALAMAMILAATPSWAVISDEEMAQTGAVIILYEQHCQPISAFKKRLTNVAEMTVGLDRIVATMIKIDQMRDKIGNKRFCELMAPGMEKIQ